MVVLVGEVVAEMVVVVVREVVSDAEEGELRATMNNSTESILMSISLARTWRSRRNAPVGNLCMKTLPLSRAYRLLLAILGAGKEALALCNSSGLRSSSLGH